MSMAEDKGQETHAIGSPKIEEESTVGKWVQSWAVVGNSFNKERLEEISRGITEDEFSSLLVNPVAAAACGFTIAGLASCKAAANHHMELNKSTKYTSKLAAQRELNDAVLREFSRTGLRMGWRVGLFAGMFGVLSFGFEKTREKKDMSNVVVAGALTGGVMRIPFGLAQVAFGTTLGGGISFAYGMLLQGIWFMESRVEKLQDNNSSNHNNSDDGAKLITPLRSREQPDALENMLKQFDIAEATMKREGLMLQQQQPQHHLQGEQQQLQQQTQHEEPQSLQEHSAMQTQPQLSSSSSASSWWGWWG
eukprot:m.103439 g.103439  ORF g.103439 m.103439 type:complete len:307 (+) comp27497_c0_seq2:200-1120(+)